MQGACGVVRGPARPARASEDPALPAGLTARAAAADPADVDLSKLTEDEAARLREAGRAVGRDGAIAYKHIGPISAETLETKIIPMIRAVATR